MVIEMNNESVLMANLQMLSNVNVDLHSYRSPPFMVMVLCATFYFLLDTFYAAFDFVEAGVPPDRVIWAAPCFRPPTGGSECGTYLAGFGIFRYLNPGGHAVSKS